MQDKIEFGHGSGIEPHFSMQSRGLFSGKTNHPLPYIPASPDWKSMMREPQESRIMDFAASSWSTGQKTTSVSTSSPSSPLSTQITDLHGYDHITWYVGNAKQAASYYVARMGFQHIAYRGLETGSRSIASHVISNGRAIFVLTSPIRGSDGRWYEEPKDLPDAEKRLLQEIQAHINTHGDAVKDVAFAVDDVEALYAAAVAKGAISVQEPFTVSTEEDGEIVTAIIKTFGNTTHTLVNRSRYKGYFMPGFRSTLVPDPLDKYLPKVTFEVIDHFVGNQDWNQMESACE